MVTENQVKQIIKLRDTCIECKEPDKGFLVNDNGTYRKCRCTIDMELASKCHEANVPAKFIYMKMDNYKYTLHNNIMKYFISIDRCIETGIGLYLYGANGCGKSFLMSQIAKQTIAKGYSVQFFKLDTIVNAIMNKDKDEDSALFLNQIQEADMLCIDEVEKVYIKPNYVGNNMSFVETVYDTLFRNSNNKKQSIITTSNKAMTEISKIHGPHIGSLFLENLVPTEIVIPADFRATIGQSLQNKFNEVLGEKN